MKILFVVPYAPTQIRTRPYNFIRCLAAAGHEVSLATVCVNEAELHAVQSLSRGLNVVIAERIHAARSAWNCMRALPNGLPMQSCYSWSPALARGATRLVETNSFDVIHIEHLRGARYALSLKNAASRRTGRGPAVIWDSVDCISSLFRQAARESRHARARIVAKFELPRTEQYEGMLATHFDRVLVTSENDRAELAALAERWRPVTAGSANERIAVVPNGVDTQYFSPGMTECEPLSLVVSGKMSYHANVTAVTRFVENIMPRIWAENPAVRLWIVGKDPAREVRRLGIVWNGQQQTESSGRDSRIRITGTVDDIRPFLHRAAVAVAPIRYCAGIQNKVLEALSSGLPVVATTEAVSSLGTIHGRHLLVARSDEEFAALVLLLLRDQELRSRLGQAGRAYVMQRHDWLAITRELAQKYLEANACV